jgi:uncharacterized protein YndB with AHSA1/START domain
MTVINTSRDPENLIMTVVAEYTASPEQVWGVWEDARKLERWWGPPTFPATFERHDFFVGGQSRYYMTGPNGEQPHGWWQIDLLDKPNRIEFLNGLAGDDGEPVPGVEPMSGVVTFEPIESGTRMTTFTHFLDNAQMEKMLGMGMEEGMRGAMDQIDGILHQLTTA